MLIDREATLKKMCESCGYCERFEKTMRSTHPGFVSDKCNNYKFIAEQPTIEPEVRHGQWSEMICYKEHGIEMADYECTNCGGEISKQRGNTPKYCEHCGANMREVSEDAED